jgi:hypothetical protein
MEHLVHDEFPTPRTTGPLNNDECFDSFEQVIPYIVDEIFPVGKQGLEASIVVLSFAKGEDVRCLALQPLVQLTVSELK